MHSPPLCSESATLRFSLISSCLYFRLFKKISVRYLSSIVLLTEKYVSDPFSHYRISCFNTICNR